jgi:hypothetical protein
MPIIGERERFASGAVRSSTVAGEQKPARFDLVSHVGLRRVAETYAEGAAKYAANNWRRGIPASNLLNHALAHLNQFAAGDASEDHLAHAAWNLFAIMEFQETRPDLIDVPPDLAREAAAPVVGEL